MLRSSRIRSTSPPRSRQFGDLLEGAGFGDLGAAEQAGDRLAQRAAEQRMIVGNHQMIGLSIVQS